MTGFFVRPCPSCGRSSQIAIDYLGMDVRCRHCTKVFVASDVSGQSEALNDPVSYWLNFSDSAMTDLPDEPFEPHRIPR